jgi:hypothetical protein
LLLLTPPLPSVTKGRRSSPSGRRLRGRPRQRGQPKTRQPRQESGDLARSGPEVYNRKLRGVGRAREYVLGRVVRGLTLRAEGVVVPTDPGLVRSEGAAEARAELGEGAPVKAWQGSF